MCEVPHHVRSSVGRRIGINDVVSCRIPATVYVHGRMHIPGLEEEVVPGVGVSATDRRRRLDRQSDVVESVPSVGTGAPRGPFF